MTTRSMALASRSPILNSMLDKSGGLDEARTKLGVSTGAVTSVLRSPHLLTDRVWRLLNKPVYKRKRYIVSHNTLYVDTYVL